MVEMTPSGKVLDTRNVDKGASGALFGIVATGTDDSNTKITSTTITTTICRQLEK